MDHSIFSPSKMHRTIVCPASVQLCLSMPPEPQSEAGVEGTLLHDYMEKLMDGGIKLEDIQDAEYSELCEQALAYVQSLEVSDKSLFFTETKVTLKDEPEVYGTTDLIILDGNMLHVIDYKFGRTYVEVKDNTQLKIYARAAIDMFDKYDIKYVTTHIVQPKISNFAHCDYGKTELTTWVNTVVHNAVAQANSDNPPFGPSAEACHWCTARAVCPAATKKAQEIASQVFSLYSSRKIDQEDVAEFYQNIPVIEGHIKAVKDYVMSSLMRGEEIPGFKLVRTRATRKFISERDVMQYFENSTQFHDDIFKTELLSPSQLEKMFGSKLKNDKNYQALITKSEGNLTVVPEDDPRPGEKIVDPFQDFVEK